MRDTRDSHGLSLVELLIVVSLLVMFATMCVMLLNSFTSMTDETQASQALASDTRIAMDGISRDLRQAQQNDAEMTNGAFSVARPTYAQFFVDTDHDAKPERVTYYTAGTTLYKVIAYPVGAAVPFTFGSTSTPTPVLEDLSVPDAAVFTYYSSDVDSSTVGLTGYAFQQVTATDPLSYATKISLVRVTLSSFVTVGTHTATTTVTQDARIRSINSDLE